MADFVVVVVVVCVIGAAIVYIVKEKKRGAKCIGCPSGGQCGGCSNAEDLKVGCGCGCHGDAG